VANNVQKGIYISQNLNTNTAILMTAPHLRTI